jgi:uncharacterized membrane protein
LNKKADKAENNKPTKISEDTPIIIKAISFFLILGSSLTLLFYFYVLVLNNDLLTGDAINNTLISPTVYLMAGSVFFVLLFAGAIFLLKLKKVGIFIVSASLFAILLMNFALVTKVDWLNLSIVFVVLLVFTFTHKKFR